MRLTGAVLPVMIAVGRGAVVNVASEAALRGSTAGAASTASKHAVAGFTRSVVFFHGPRSIRANAVAPGAVATNIEAPMRSECAAGRVGPLMQVVVRPVAQAEQLAAAITWLLGVLGDDAANVYGVVLPNDGGWSVI